MKSAARAIGFGCLLLVVMTSGCDRMRNRNRSYRPGAPAPAPSPAPVPKIELPDLEKVPVSDAGRKAIGDVARAQGFGGTAVGVAGTPTAPVSGWRVLLAEPHASDAFVYVMKHGTTVGKLFALAGLYYSDPAAFARELPAMRAVNEKVPVLFNGCMPGGTPTLVSDIIEKPGAVRLSAPSETLSDWSGRNPGKNIELDIVGGGYPASFRPYVPKPAPSASAL